MKKTRYFFLLMLTSLLLNACDHDYQEVADELLFGYGYNTCGDISFTYMGQEVTYGTIQRGGLCWMDRDLGASSVGGHGDLFQWGRLDDGHQNRTSNTTSTLSNTDVPGHGNFITVSSSPWDWRSPQNNNLWQGENGINNPCPPGWRVPTESELNKERKSWERNNLDGAKASTLKWRAGYIRLVDGTLHWATPSGLMFAYVWSSSVSDSDARCLYIDYHSFTAGMRSCHRALGMSVRCVRDL